MRITYPRKSPGIAAILLLPVLVVAFALSFFLFNSFQAKRYYERAENITSNLEDEINTLEAGFKKLGTTVSTSDQGKRTPETHLDLIKPAKSNISDLETEYKDLSVPNKAKELDEKLTSVFELTDSFVRKYERTAQFNKDVYNAYGDTLNNELDNFTKNYYRGGDRVVFITQTEGIENLSADAIKKMQILNPSDDDKGYYDLKLKHLYNLKSAFSSLNYYYRYNQFDQAQRETASLTAKTDSLNLELEQNAKKYITNSSVAQDLKKLKEQLEEIDDEYF